MASKKVAKKAAKKAASKATKKAPSATRTPVAPSATRKPAHTPAGSKASTQSTHAGVDGNATQQAARVNALVHKVNGTLGSKGGAPVLRRASEVSSNSHIRRPSGIMQLDIDCAGGVPAQELTTIGGPGNAGKSTLLYHYYAQHQRLYGDKSVVAITCSEGNIDYEQAHRCGWAVAAPENRIDDIQRSRKEKGAALLTMDEVRELRREIGTNLVVEATTMEAILDVNLQMLESNDVGIIGIDSYEGLLPGAEAALDSLEDNGQQAQRASLITRFVAHYNAAKKSPKHYTSLIITTQVRSNRRKSEQPVFMQKYSKDYSGDKVAYALQHARALSIELDSGAKLDDKTKGISGAKIVKGKQVTWKITKGKSGAHDNTYGESPYYYDARCFDNLTALVGVGIRYGVIREVAGSLTFYVNNGPDEYLRNIPNKELFVQALREEPASEWLLRWAICTAAGVSPVYS